MDILLEGLQVTIIGMSLVFFVLVSLMFFLQLLSTFFYKIDQSQVKAPIKSVTDKKKGANLKKNLDEDIAVVTTVMAEILDKQEAIINIKPINK